MLGHDLYSEGLPFVFIAWCCSGFSVLGALSWDGGTSCVLAHTGEHTLTSGTGNILLRAGRTLAVRVIPYASSRVPHWQLSEDIHSSLGHTAFLDVFKKALQVLLWGYYLSKCDRRGVQHTDLWR